MPPFQEQETKMEATHPWQRHIRLSRDHVAPATPTMTDWLH